MDRSTPLLPDSDHLKSVWALSPSSGNSSREVQNSLKGISDDFLPSSIPLNVNDLPMSAGLESKMESKDANGLKAPASPHAAPSRFDASTNTSLEQRSQSHSPQHPQPVGAKPNGFDSSSRSSPTNHHSSQHSQSSSPFQRTSGLPPIPSLPGANVTSGSHSNAFGAAPHQAVRPPSFNPTPYPYGAPNAFAPYASGMGSTGSPYLPPGNGSTPMRPPQPSQAFGGYSPFAGNGYPSLGGTGYSPFGQPQRLPSKPSAVSAFGQSQGQANWGNGNAFASNVNGMVGMGMSWGNSTPEIRPAPTPGYLQHHQSPQPRTSGLNINSPAFRPSSQAQAQNQPRSNQSSSTTNSGSNNNNNAGGRAPPPHMLGGYEPPRLW